MESAAVIQMSAMLQDLKFTPRQNLTPTYWSCPTPPEAADTPESYNTYTDLVTYRPEEYQPQSVYANESSYGQMLFQLPMNVMAEDSGQRSPCFDSSHVKSEYSSGYDEGIGSNPSSSNPSPVIPSPEHHNMEYCSSPSYFPQVEANTTRDSGIDYAEPQASLGSQIEFPKTECLRCGTTFSNFWCQKGIGHFLCERCANQEREAAISAHAQDVSAGSGHVKRKNKTTSRISDRVCVNCFTTDTPLWRRDENQQFLCNACALYKKLHKKSRPQSMNKGTIQTRNRKPKSGASKHTKTRPTKASASSHSTMNMKALEGLLELHPPSTSSAHTSSFISKPESSYAMYSTPERTQKASVILPPMSNSMASFYNFVSDRVYQPSYSYHNEIAATCGN